MGHRRQKDAIEIAHTTFVEFLRVRGFGDAISKIKPHDQCRYGAGQIIIPFEGIRDSSRLQEVVEREGYDHATINNEITDAAEFCVYVPYVKEADEKRGRRPEIHKRRTIGWGVSPIYLAAGLVVLILFGLSQTPSLALRQFFW